jgi:hypothetical protein
MNLPDDILREILSHLKPQYRLVCHKWAQLMPIKALNVPAWAKLGPLIGQVGYIGLYVGHDVDIRAIKGLSSAKLDVNSDEEILTFLELNKDVIRSITNLTINWPIEAQHLAHYFPKLTEIKFYSTINWSDDYWENIAAIPGLKVVKGLMYYNKYDVLKNKGIKTKHRRSHGVYGVFVLTWGFNRADWCRRRTRDNQRWYN